LSGMLSLIVGIFSWVIFSVNGSVIYLSFFDWYRREESVGLAFKVAAVFSIFVSIIFMIIYSSGINDVLKLYWDIVLSSFVLSLMILYPYVSWVRKKIYNHYYVAAYLAYNIVLWFIFPLFYLYVMGFDVPQTLFASYTSAAILGTLLATAIIREIRPKEVMLGGIPALTTAITIADMGTGVVSAIVPKIGIGVFSISFVHIALFLSIVLQYFYYKKVVGE